MNQGEKLYYSISEVSEMLDVNPSLLRFWEKEFAEYIKPKKNRNGKRMFTNSDIDTLKQIYHLTKEKGYTLVGAKNALKGNKKNIDKTVIIYENLRNLHTFLTELKRIINKQ